MPYSPLSRYSHTLITTTNRYRRHSTYLRINRHTNVNSRVIFLRSRLISHKNKTMTFRTSSITTITQLTISISTSVTSFNNHSRNTISSITIISRTRTSTFTSRMMNRILNNSNKVRRMLNRHTNTNILLRRRKSNRHITRFISRISFLPSTRQKRSNNTSRITRMKTKSNRTSNSSTSINFSRQASNIIRLRSHQISNIFNSLKRFLRNRQFTNRIRRTRLCRTSHRFRNSSIRFYNIRDRPSKTTILTPLRVTNLLSNTNFCRLNNSLNSNNKNRIRNFNSLHTETSTILMRILRSPQAINFKR